ncbi:mannose-ethanolamine phosphotransferase gpi13 [Kappamyces sp. JEL0680]|nr:mannose-ethanolamine phosphotransferase gpi13 [Kappamyces sp. JEL0680]
MNQASLKLVVLVAVQLLGLFLFKEGFLLSRLELSQIGKLSSQGPHQTPRFQKTILVMIDALRYDFMKWVPDIDRNHIPHYINKMPVIRDKLDKEPRHALLFRGQADPPTTTLQRLMAMMTGALPTLVDAGSNFASAALREDNLIEKILGQGKRIVSLGDDTWDRLFPSSINESYFYPSFDVWDLHSVDLGVLEHLMPMLDKKDHDWGFVIAHFLGVDHAGHRYGPGHEIFEKVHDDTLVIVMGDHGMDAKGDHGGDSEQEIDAALFFYSKTALTTADPLYDQTIEDVVLGIQGLDPDFGIFSRHNGDRTVQQIDMVPTIAALMGLGIPFGNLGMVIPEFFVGSDLQRLLEETDVNARQIHTYLEAYGAKRADAKAAFAKSRFLYDQALQARQTMQSVDDQINVYLLYTRFIRHTLLVARAIWSRFDSCLMAMGVVLLALSLLLALRMYSFDVRLNPASIAASMALGLVGLFSPIRAVVYPGQDADTITLHTHHEVLFFTAMAFSLAVLWNTSLPGRSPSRHVLYRIGTVLVLLYACTLGSDSFLIFEDFVLLHFIQFLHAVSFLYSLWHNRGREEQLRIIAGAVLVRTISLVTICRPDQGPYCVPTFNATATSSISAYWTIYPLIALSCLAAALAWREKREIASYFASSLFCSTAYWTIDMLENYQVMAKFPAKDYLVYLYWLVLLLAVLGPARKSNALWIGFMFLVLFQKPMGAIVLTLTFLYVWIARDFVCAPQLLFFVGWLSFFSTGHQNILSTVQYDVGFIGFKNANMVLSPLFIALNTFGGPMLVAFQPGSDREKRIQWARQLLLAVFFTGWFSRHSQAFRVWGPKFLFFAPAHVLSSLVSLLVLALRDDEKDKKKEE